MNGSSASNQRSRVGSFRSIRRLLDTAAIVDQGDLPIPIVARQGGPLSVTDVIFRHEGTFSGRVSVSTICLVIASLQTPDGEAFNCFIHWFIKEPDMKQRVISLHPA